MTNALSSLRTLADASGEIIIACNEAGGTETWLEIDDGMVTCFEGGHNAVIDTPTVATVQRWQAQGYTD